MDADLICASLRDCPQHWRSDGYWLRHVNGGIAIWIANGPLMFSSEGSVSVSLGFIGRWKVWWEYRKWRHDMVRRILKVEAPTVSSEG